MIPCYSIKIIFCKNDGIIIQNIVEVNDILTKSNYNRNIIKVESLHWTKTI